MAGIAIQDDAEETYVSMHHRIRRSLRRRLKHLSADIERPVTDIVNEAIEQWFEKHEGGRESGARSEVKLMTNTSERIEFLRERKAAGGFYAAVAGLKKAELLAMLSHLDESADQRMSTDRLVCLLAKSLS